MLLFFFLTIRCAFLRHGGVAATAAFITGIYGEWKTIANESLLPVGLELQTMQQHLCWRAEVPLPQSHGTGGGEGTCPVFPDTPLPPNPQPPSSFSFFPSFLPSISLPIEEPSLLRGLPGQIHKASPAKVTAHT